ncbi:MAG: NAD(+)/NADH kinase [Lachnospiraceae bacterium]|nr:NAD(+)/NADH kinase [Lachnospiraceae bacterium]
MKNFCIIRNITKDPLDDMTSRIRFYLENKGATCYVCEEEDPITPETECGLVLGGDGTLLRAAKKALSADIPLIGINLGTLGYLAEVDRLGVYEALDSLLNDEYTLEKRMMLTGSIFHEGREVYTDVALNDIVISRDGSPRIILFENYVNGAFLTNYQADAMIISTPTGSTGYALSAGSPIVSPRADLILMTPLAPHTLNARSIIFPDTDEIRVRIGAGRVVHPERAMVDFDGSVGFRVETGDEIVIRRAKASTKIIKIKQESFLETLRRKLGNN